MKILLIGKAGQIGYELERRLASMDGLIAPDRSAMDLSKPAQIRELIRCIKPGLIINAAAYTDVDKAEDEPELAMAINAHAPEVMATEARKIGAALIHYSTDYVFDGTKAQPYVEDDVPNPINVYGLTKLAGEQAVQASGAGNLILRTSWVYGLRRKNFLTIIQQLAQERPELSIVNDQFGSPTYCGVVASITIKLIKLAETGKLPALRERQGEKEVLHLCCGGRASRYEFAKAVVEHRTCTQLVEVKPIATRDFPTRARRPASSVLSCKKLQGMGIHLPTWKAGLDLCFSTAAFLPSR